MLDFRRWRDRDRLIVAFALAIALHEVILAVVHGPARPSENDAGAVATHITIQTPPPTPRPGPTPRPTPTPPPTQPPTPRPRVTPPPHSTPAPVRQVAGRAKGRLAKTHGGGAPKPVAVKTVSVAVNTSTAGTGSGTSTGVGSGTTPGTGGGQGGEGNGNGGNGNGAVNADTPCGVVRFLPVDVPRYTSGTAYEKIGARVSFPDGHEERVTFPYQWVYPNGEQNDPWSRTNAKSEEPIVLQTPPPGSNVATFPPLVQYILSHTRSDGTTVLHDCPPQPRG